ncbi:MAG: hypothetical protein KKD66_26820 [Proteobacteria bacterium]|nr:hypothetical protein [Pseudomonadota bacterium]MBU1599377.1 hypothetical protein [bacterium]
MPYAVEIRHRLEEVFEDVQARVLTDVIVSAYDELVKTSDFNELKGIVREIAQEQKELVKAQKRTDISMKELAEAQKRTEVRVEELAEAQKRTETEIQKLIKGLDELRIEVSGLAKGLKETRGELGGLSRSMGYAFENEVYRMLPKFLSDTYGINLKEKLIRTEIGGKEINILGRATMKGKDVVVVGEAKLRLDERRKKPDVFEELEEKVLAVKEEYKEEVVRILISHYATKGFMEEARDKGVIVISSFEW